MLKVHFLNVGHGDCAIIEFPNRRMMIDINNGEAIDEMTKNELMETFSISQLDLMFKPLNRILAEKGYALTNPIQYIRDLGVTTFFRFVLSHPHMDHMTGLNALVNGEKVRMDNFWHSGVDIEKPDFNKSIYNEEDWDTYVKLKDSQESPKNLVKNTGDTGEFWTDDGIEILSPTDALKELALEKNRLNLCSYVFLITYKEYKIVLAGDAEKENWDYIVENYADKITNINILKAAHHGRESGFHEEAVKLMNPEYTIVSVGKKPDTDAHNKYKKYTRKKVLSTRFRGNIVVSITDYGWMNVDWEYNKND